MVYAQAWPAKPVRLIVNVGPGVPPDLVMRLVAEKLANKLGRPFVVDNVLGGGGITAGLAMAQAAPDGYTFYLGGVGIAATDRYMFKSLPYDPDKDFAPVAVLYDSTTFGLAVSPDLPVKTIADLINMAKTQPGKLSYGSEAAGVQAITGQYFNLRAGITMEWVPYKAPPQMLADAVSGRLPVIWASMLQLEQFLSSGKLRVIAISRDKRLPGKDGIPAIAETFPGFRVVGIGIVFAPSRTPSDIMQKLNSEMDLIVRDAEYQKRLQTFGFTSLNGAGTAAEIAQFMKSERDNWANVFKSVKIEAQ
ncbi:MAG: Bug family tripartite tricarboxylate transporter substrate binding protein [Burkholderiales bacterium]